MIPEALNAKAEAVEHWPDRLQGQNPMPSAAFERFRFSFFEDPYSARDGLDTAVLAALEGAERRRAEDMLLDYLPDTRGVIGLGVLRSQRAEPALTKLLAAERDEGIGSAQAYLAKALWQIRPDPRWLEAEIEVLTCADEPMQRMEAALALYYFRDPAAARALVTALDDPKALVRHHAARGLLALHGLPHPSSDPQHMMFRVMSDNAERRESGKRDILAAIAGRPISEFVTN
jgi:HEAT repeat protein